MWSDQSGLELITLLWVSTVEWLDAECSGSDIILNCLARYLIMCGVSEVMMCHVSEASGTHL